ncbi:uncharacterized protein LOC142491010 isoform X2 [Ascaphus truei]
MYSITMENTDTVEAKSNKERTASKIMRGKQSKNLREERASPVDQRLAIPELRGSWMSRGHGSAPHLETNPDCESTYVDPLSSDYCNFAFGSASPYGNVFHSEYQCIESADESDIYENTRIGQRKESDNDYATGDFDAAAFLEKNYDV